ncbi:MAG: hypothetical protein KME35_08230 [Aphanocapsa sp. GSE-SYN-MK-11-07L]|nr:hypothetical protein [Aphanocapsa sp. GSE-SYN-MK-11-07L]
MTRISVRSFSQPLDRAALTVMFVLAVLTGLLLLTGDHTLPKVRDFSWQNRQVGADDRSFVLSFNRLMNWQSVTQHLQITPQLTGKTSWAGRRLAYTLDQPVLYGRAFQVELAKAEDDALVEADNQPKQMQPFSGQFRSRDRVYLYIGVEPAEVGRLVMQNLTLNRKTILTPANLVVSEFKPYSSGDRVLFSANQRAKDNQSSFDPQLYIVSTGLQIHAPDTPLAPKQAAGKVKLVLDNRDYQLLKFDLAADGQNIVVQRAAKANQGQTSLWLLRPDQDPQLLSQQSGGDFLIAPDSNTLVIAQGQGLAVSALSAQQDLATLDFLPQFGMVLSFASDGSAAAMVKFNSDYTRSLFLVTNQGTQKQLFKTTGSIVRAEFDPTKQMLYCLLTKLLPGEGYNEQPYLAAIDVATGKLTPLLDLPGQREVQISLAPDGSALIFDQVVAAPTEQGKASNLQTEQGQAIATSNLWLLPITAPGSAQVTPPQPLAAGFHARWMP